MTKKPPVIDNNPPYPMIKPERMRTGRSNAVSSQISPEKLNGVVYTPPWLARELVARMPMVTGARWLDPSAGEGVFMAAALERAANCGVAIHVEGWEIDGDAASRARTVVAAAAARCPDGTTWKVVHRDALAPTAETFDVVVGNPPYLESKRMPDALKRRLKELCPLAAVGAFDLYGAFVELGVRLLTGGGALSFILPNRVAVTANASRIRTWIASLGELTVIDLSLQNPFPDAAVYPTVVELRKDRTPALRVAPFGATHMVTFDIADVADRFGGRWPLPQSAEAAALVRRITAIDVPRIGDVFRVRCTTSFHGTVRDQFVSETRPGTPFARPFLGGGRFAGNREVQPCSIAWAGTWIDYDERRAHRCNNPLPPLGIFVAPKVVICQNARRCRVAVDEHGYVLKDTLLAARLLPPYGREWLFWLPIVMHSRLFHVLYDAILGGSRKGGGFLHFFGSYLEPLPLPPPPADFDAEQAYRRCAAQGAFDAPDLEATVAAAFGLDDDQRAWLEQQSIPPF